MNKKLRELRSQRDEKLGEAAKLLETAKAEQRDLNETEVKPYETAMSEANLIGREIKIEEERAEAERGVEGRNIGDDGEALTEFRSFVTNGETRAMSVGTESEGGHMVPEQVDRTIQTQLAELSPFRRAASVVSTSTADWKRLISKRGSTSGWAGETDIRAATDTANLEQIKPPSGELFAYPAITNFLLDDAGFNVEAFLREDVATDMAVRESSAFLSGDGADKPKGILTYPTDVASDDTRPFGTLQHSLAAEADRISPDELIDLVYSLRPAYRQGAVWLMNSKSAGYIRKMKDADGRYLWQESITEGQPPRLLGYPVVEVEDAPDIAADAMAVTFGNFRRGYVITDRLATRVIRDNITQPGWTKFYFARRTGGAVTDSNAIKFLKMAAAA